MADLTAQVSTRQDDTPPALSRWAPGVAFRVVTGLGADESARELRRGGGAVRGLQSLAPASFQAMERADRGIGSLNGRQGPAWRGRRGHRRMVVGVIVCLSRRASSRRGAFLTKWNGSART